MNSVSLGPFALSADRFAALLALSAFLIAAEVLGRRRRRPELIAWAWNAALVALIGARLGYVLTHLQIFGRDPLAVLQFWQGGFAAWAGVLAALLYAVLRFRGERRILALTLLPALAALIAWGGFTAVSLLSRPAESPTLFATRLERLGGDPLSPVDLLGTPVVLNLWATWCGPCRRELPLLAAVAAEEAGVAFVFVSQGESAARVEGYLAERGLVLPTVLLDPAGEIGRAARSRALPTTLFFDSEGRMVFRSLGELSRARLQDGIERIRRADSAP